MGREHPLLPTFCTRPIFRAAECEKSFARTNFVRVEQERLLRRLTLTSLDVLLQGKTLRLRTSRDLSTSVTMATSVLPRSYYK